MVITKKMRGDPWKSRTDDWSSQHSTRSRHWGAHWVPSGHSEPSYKTFYGSRATNTFRREIWQPVSKQHAEAKADWQSALQEGAGAPQARRTTWQPISRQGAAECRGRRETWQPVFKEEAHCPAAACMKTAISNPKELHRNEDSEPLIDPTSGELSVESASSVSDAQIPACDAMAMQHTSDSELALKEEMHRPRASESKDLQRNLDSEPLLDPLVDPTSGGSTEDSASSVSSNASTGEPTNIIDAEEELSRMVSVGSDHARIAKLNWADYSSSDEDTLIQTCRLDVKKGLSTALQRTANAKSTADAGFSVFPLPFQNDRLNLYATYCDFSREGQPDKRESCCAGKGHRKKRIKNKMKEFPTSDSTLKASLEKHLAEKQIQEPPHEPNFEEYKAVSQGLAAIFRTFQEVDGHDEWIESDGATEEEEDIYEDAISEADKGDCAARPSSNSMPRCLPPAFFFEQISSALVAANSPPRRSRRLFVAVFAVVVVVLQITLVFSEATTPIYPLAVFAWWAFCRAALW